MAYEQTSATQADPQTLQTPPRRPWQTPQIEDADIPAITNGTGTSGVEGTAFLKPGS